MVVGRLQTVLIANSVRQESASFIQSWDLLVVNGHT